jgi:hypothetical protein
MDSIVSKIIGDIELRENCAEWAKDIQSIFSLHSLMRIQEEFIERFCFGILGIDAFVQIHANNEILEDLKKLPYFYKSWEEKILNGGKRIMNNERKEVKHEWFMDREQSKEFFSLFANINPQLDRVYIHNQYSIKNCVEFSEEEIEKSFYSENYEERGRAFDEVVNRFKQNVAPLYNVKKISVLFGNSESKNQLGLRLTFHQNTKMATGTGTLRLNFTYYTWDSLKLTHLPLRFHRKIKSDKKKDKKKKEEEKKGKVVTKIKPSVTKKRKEREVEMTEERAKILKEIKEFEKNFYGKYGTNVKD